MPPKLRLEKVGLKYGRQVVFQDISASLFEGEAWAIVGPNGAGKSSLLSLMAGYLTPTAGKIERSTSLSELAWQSPHVHPPPDSLVRDIVEDWKALKAAQIPPDFYERWKLPPHKPLHTLSSGMRQRLLVALALTLERGIILLDEPTAFMDRAHKHAVHEVLRNRMGDPAILIVCATNDPEEVAIFPNVLRLYEYAA